MNPDLLAMLREKLGAPRSTTAVSRQMPSAEEMQASEEARRLRLRNRAINEAAAIIKEHEGFREKPYLDPGGNLTIGIGQLIRRNTGQRVNRQQAEQFMMNRLNEDADQLTKAHVPLTGGMLSATYNLGMTKAREHGLVQNMASGHPERAVSTLRKLLYSNGKIMAGLPRRRRDEIASILAPVNPFDLRY